jgi:hypothetical protein
VAKTRNLDSKVATAKVEDGRIRLPQHISSKLSWLQGTEVLNVWLLVEEAGRYRVLADQHFETSAALREIREIVLRDGEDEDNSYAPEGYPECAETASLRARLLPAQLSPKGPCWRLSIPAELPPENTADEGRTLYLLLSQGHLEIWSKDRFEELLRLPISKLRQGR